MIVVFAPSRASALRAARKRGLRPERQCILVWDAKTIELTCLQDYQAAPIEVEQELVPEYIKLAWAQYLDLIIVDSRQGFGWRNMWTWETKDVDSTDEDLLE